MLVRPLTRPLVRPLTRRVTEPFGGIALLSVDSYRADTSAAALPIATYDAGNELTHPGVWDAHRDTGADWNGYRYWMAATPYAASNNQIENPCIYASDDLETWVEPVGLTNPIESEPGGTGYNSDPHLVWGRDGYLYCIFRQVLGPEPSEHIYYLRSADGVTWGDKTLLLQSDAAEQRLMSPAVEWDGSQWVMYAVEILPSPNTLVRLTAAALAGPWSEPTVCTVTVPSGRDVWHIDAKHVNGKWLLLLQETELDNGAGGNLYLCDSSDGLAFTRPANPVMPCGGAWHELNYRSSFVPKNYDGRYGFDLVYAGVGSGTVWYLGRTEILPFDKQAYDAEPVTAIAGAAANEPPYLLGDDFDRADGAIGTSTGGEAWTASAGTFLVASGKAMASAAANTRAFMDAGAADIYADVLVTHLEKGSWLIVRLSDANNYWRIGFNGITINAQKVVAGGVTIVESIQGFSPNRAGRADTARLSVRASGGDFEVMYDGSIVLRFTDAFNSTATKCGIQTDSALNQFDDFFVRSLVGGS